VFFILLSSDFIVNIMNYLYFLLLGLLLALIWMSWRYFLLRRSVDNHTSRIFRAAKGQLPIRDLMPHIKNIEALSSSVHNLVSAYNLQLSTSEAERSRLAAILDQMTDGVLIADDDGRIQLANPAAEKLLGEGQSLPGRSVVITLRHHQLVEAWRKCQQLGELQIETVEMPSSRQFLQVVAIPDRQSNGSLLMVQDLTRIRRLETVRRDFISNVSHELRTPLASLKALTETLQEGALEDPPAARRFLGRIQTEVDALTQMATELLELSRIESGQVPLEFKPVSPFRLILSTAERMKMQAERAGLTIHVDCAPELPSIRGDAPRLEQVIVNLIHNAVKFTPPGGEVTLTASPQQGGFICFLVHDTGVGIPTDDISRVFERFYKIDRARSGGGTGLGLSISRHIVEAHGGKIWAESVEGRGSTFFFTIPLA
jgi:two-component system phosphate regulon sensor histidine kinase PhoR